MVCYNCGVQVHYSRKCPKLAKNCSYYKQEHNVEQWLQLLAQWKSHMVGAANTTLNPIMNANSNIQMIVIEPREPNLVVVTRGGAMMGADQATQIEPATQA